MKIAVITNTLPPCGQGGAERYAAALATAMAARHEVLVLSGSAEAVAGVRVRALPALPELREESRFATRALWHARDQWRWAVHRAIDRELTSFLPDVVHTHEPQGLTAAVFSGYSARAPHVYTAHDFNALCMRTTMSRGVSPCSGRCAPCLVQRAVRGRLLRKSVARLIGPSRYVVDRHVAHGVIAPDRAQVIPHGAPEAVFRARTPSGVITFGFIGALRRHKGVPLLLQAFEALPGDSRLVVAGDGPMRDEVRAAVRRDSRIRYLGTVAGRVKEEFFDGIDALVVPSQVDEVAPLVVVEAAVCGVPSIVSARGGLPEAPGAMPAQIASAADLRALMAGLVAAPARIAEASTALKRIAVDLRWESHVSKVEQVLENVVAEGTTPCEGLTFRSATA